MPKISIIIPTRNRAFLLGFALKSALEQTYHNLEIIVCDNYCEDRTREIVDSLKNERVKYIKTDKVLSMPDNWEFALKHATGEYITFLTDDSYLLPRAIEVAMNELKHHHQEVSAWRHGAYFSPDWVEIARKNIIYFPKVTNRSYVIKSQLALKNLFDGKEDIVPKSLNSLIHYSLINKVIKTQGKFFLPHCPDFASATSTLLNSQEYLLIDQVLYLDGVTPASIGANSSFNLGKSARAAIEEFGGDLDNIMFLGMPVSPGSIARSLENVRKFYPDICPKLNIKNLLCAITDRLLKQKANGLHIDGYWQKFNEYSSRQPMITKLAILKQIIFSKIKWTLIKIIRSSPFLEKLETLRGVRILRGKDHGFHNIEEAGKFLASLNDKK